VSAQTKTDNVLTAEKRSAKAAISPESKDAINQALPLIRSKKKLASVRVDENYWKDVWPISPDSDTSTWYAMPEQDKPVTISYITDLDSIGILLHQNEVYNFSVVTNENDTAYIQFKAAKPKAKFSKAYQHIHRNRTIIEIPEMYELINVVFALSSLSDEEDSHVVRKDIPYYDEVVNWFRPYKNHKCVKLADSILRDDFSMYWGLKMDTYIYDLGEDDDIISKGIYDRIAQNIGENVISHEFLFEMEQFSKISRFKEFYDLHQGMYNDQISYYRNDLNIAQMQAWLNKNFPKTSYDCFKVIFSPLVDWNQSAAWFDNDGFKEAQAHVNFPYPSEADKSRFDVENKLRDGQILFTEFNHAFINPEAEPYFDSLQFKEAFDDISPWVVKESIAAKSYSQSTALFNEYMNWSLVSIYLLDHAPEDIANKMIASNEDWQLSRRGFKHFKSFNQNLIKLYKSKQKGQTVSDLYPEIFNWCQKFIKNKT